MLSTYSSFLVYVKEGQTYRLVVNESKRTSLSFHCGLGVRARTIDYFCNGTDYVITILGDALVLVRYQEGGRTIRVGLPFRIRSFGFDVGDVNSDGMVDIVHALSGYDYGGGFQVLENQGNGRYSRKKGLGGPPDPSALSPWLYARALLVSSSRSTKWPLASNRSVLYEVEYTAASRWPPSSHSCQRTR